MSLFIYRDSLDSVQLHQGDVLISTPYVKTILEMSYPNFPGKDYTHFMVLTQSCDLVIRGEGGACAVPYITLAAISDFEGFLDYSIAMYQQHLIETKGHLVSQNFYQSARNLLERLFNNNEDDYFYLPEDVQKDFPDSVALLRLVVTIEAQPHYAECLKAKTLELDDTFKAKLGWIVGKIYSRVGTEDWTTKEMSQEAFNDWINKVLKDNFMWIEHRALQALRKNYTEEAIAALGEEDIRKLADKTRPPSKRDQLIEIVKAKLMESGIIDEEITKKILTSIKNDQSLSTIVRN